MSLHSQPGLSTQNLHVDYPSEAVVFSFRKPASVVLALIKDMLIFFGALRLDIEPGWAAVFEDDILHMAHGEIIGLVQFGDQRTDTRLP